MKTVIGLEIHVQLLTETKAFCSCSANVFEKAPNTMICPVCTGQPGALPTVNKMMIEYAVRTALALNCEIHRFSRFDRKNYFYPDLPKGYQITQYFYPIATNGCLELDVGKERKKVRIRRLHIEEDAGKLMHEGDAITKAHHTLVDMNRCGVPLIEIVTEPDLTSPREARRFLEKLRSILRYLRVSSGDMEKGALRCDANISVVDEKGFSSNRVEVKNMNSFKFVEKALQFEQNRIIQALKSGSNVEKETRGWDLTSKTTVSMRGKEEESDYRYFPEPDIPPVVISDEYIEKIKESLPELPDQKKDRFTRDYGIPELDAEVLTSTRELADFYEECVKIKPKPKEISNWIMTELLREMKNSESEVVPISPRHLVELIELVETGSVSIKMAKEMFPEIFATKKMPRQIVEERGLKQVNDKDVIEKIIKQAMEQNPKAVRQYRSGKKGVLGYFVGAVMKQTQGMANPQLVNEIARKLLEG